MVISSLWHRTRIAILNWGDMPYGLSHGPWLDARQFVSVQVLEQVDQNGVLWPHVTLVPVELIVPMTCALIDGCGIITVADLNNHGLLVCSQDEVKGHALRSHLARHFEGDLDALWVDSVHVIHNIATARSPKIAWANVTRIGEGSVANDGHARVELVVGNEVLKVDVPSLASQRPVELSDSCQRSGEPLDYA